MKQPINSIYIYILELVVSSELLMTLIEESHNWVFIESRLIINNLFRIFIIIMQSLIRVAVKKIIENESPMW